MKKRIPLLLLAVVALAGCSKTNELYGGSEYNSPNFEENYYTKWDGIDTLSISTNPVYKVNPNVITDGVVNLKNDLTGDNYNPEGLRFFDADEYEFGYHFNLSQTEEKFSYGILSKLFDGRVRCDQLYQKSRVQLDKSGFAMYFPKVLAETKWLGFAARGGSDFGQGEEFTQKKILMNFDWSFYVPTEVEDQYAQVTYQMKDVPVFTDNGGLTSLITFMPRTDAFHEIEGAIGMSLTWSSNDPYLDTRDVVDDYKIKEKHHLALMLYEVFIGESTWVR